MSLRRSVVMAAVAFATAACTAANGTDPGTDTDATFAAEMASSWHWAGDPQRIEIGIFASDADGIHVVAGGTVEIAFAFLGSDGGGEPTPGPTSSARFVPVPGTQPVAEGPTIASGARGVYEADDVTFDRPGFWEATLTAAIDGTARSLTARFPVSARSPIPAPGDRALRTENLTLDSKGVPDAAIDSLAAGGGEIPDPELHRWTIADAIRRHRPALVLFGTPAYCESRLCGPELQAFQQLAARYADRAVYIHVEIWKDKDRNVVNRAAADWLLRDNDLTDPWLFLIDSDGVIVDRWGSIFDEDQVAAELEQLPSA